MKKSVLLMGSLLALIPLMAFSNGQKDTSNAAGTTNVVKISVGYENATSEPAAKAVAKWADLVKQRSNGSMKLELFPNSALGKKTELIDQMIIGQPIITVADGAFLADYGVPDFGIFYAPFMFDNWDDVWNVTGSSWYKNLCDQLAKKASIRVLSSNWIYGARDMLTVKKVETPSDLGGLKIRVSSNKLSIVSFSLLGAAVVGMDMGDVYQALQAKTIDGVENPVTSLANRSFQEVAKYLCKDHHIYATSMWICGEGFFKSLTTDQQKILAETADEAGLFNNNLQDEASKDAEKKLLNAGVTITTPTAVQQAAWVSAAQPFFKMATKELGWSAGLYDTVKKASKQK